MSSHYEETMQRDITRLRGKVADMAALAGQALEAALKAFINRDAQLAYKVILRDRRIDELETEIDRLCLEFIVRQQPVAKHLRFAYSAIKINLEIERIGDYAESIARQVLKIARIPGELLEQRITEIASRSIPMLRDAVRALIDEDAELARRTMLVEDEVNTLKSKLTTELFQLRVTDKLPIEALSPLSTIVRRFERVADQAKNICEEVIYLLTGEYLKHVGSDVWRVIFVDDDNSCLSQMAEAIGHSLAEPTFVFASAGVTAGQIDPEMLRFLRGKGIDVDRLVTQSVDQVPNFEFAQIVVALTPQAKRGFAHARKAVVFEWTELPNPALENTAARREAAYEEAFKFLHRHISDLREAMLADRID